MRHTHNPPSADPSDFAPPLLRIEEQPEYAAEKVADDIYAVSYCGSSGYTLTVVLDFNAYAILARTSQTG